MKRFIFIIFLLSILGGLYYIYSNFWLTINLKTKTFQINEGESVSEISTNLDKQGIVKSRLIFETYIWWKKRGSNMQVGEYTISPGTPLNDLAKKLITPPGQKEKKITIIEGWTVRDIGFYFENLGIRQAEGLWELVGFQGVDYRKNNKLPRPKDFSGEYDFLSDKPKYLGLEGYLFPDTYRIREAGGVEEATRKMLDNFGRKLTPELRAEINHQGKSIFDIVRMASVIEGEVRGEEDRKMVSDIFWRRLAIGMPLQADSTINYFTFKNNPQSRSEDLKVDSPWNTYKYRGLPLGPIGNPGLESILAAIYPKPNQYLYFLTDKDGVAHYAKTLDEHIKNRSKYLK